MRRIPVLRSIIAILIASFAFGPPLAAAQTSSAPSGDITITGYGQATAPADTATLQITVSSPNYGPPMAPDPDATPGAAERESVSPVVDALVYADVPESDIEVIVAPYLSGVGGSYVGPAVALVTVSLDDPSTQGIVDLVNAASSGAAQERLLIGTIGVTFEVGDCAALQRDARDAAIADARNQATMQARLLDVSLGDVTASRNVPIDPETLLLGPYGGPRSESGCEPADLSSYYGPFVAPPFDPTSEADVTVSAYIELTFDMSADQEATPAP